MQFLTQWLRSQLKLLRASAVARRLARRGTVIRHRGWAFRLVALTVAGVMALFVASALGVLTGSPSKFESGDGNMTVETSGNTDWNCFKSAFTINVSENGSTCGTVNEANYVSFPAPNAYTAKDISWKPGQKQDAACPALVESKDPAKDTFTHVASYNETAFTGGKLGDTFLYGATIRFTANGNASENVELNQKEGTSECSIPRTVGDKLVAINYLKGGTEVEITVLTWITSTTGPNSESGENKGTCLVGNDTPPCWGAKEQTLSSNAAEGQANQSEIAAIDNGLSGQALVAGQFAEFGINLSKAGIIPEGSCKGFAQTVWESRSSGSSFTSNPEDIEIEKHPISNCGVIKVIKKTVPAGLSQVFSYTSTLPKEPLAGGVVCPSASASGVEEGGNFCLNADNSVNKTANKVERTELNPGPYEITEGAEPTGFGFGGVKCTNQSGTTVAESPTNPKVSLSLGILETITCVYTNNQQLGAIKIAKTSIKGATALSGAGFEICTNNGPYTTQNPCTPAKTGSDTLLTGPDGTVCVDPLTFGSYYVTETSAPTGFNLDDTSTHLVKVEANAKCSDQTYVGQSIAFKDTPLTDLTITAKSEASTGGTSSTITCEDSGKNGIGNSPQSGGTATVTANPTHKEALKPGTYTCTVVVDP